MITTMIDSPARRSGARGSAGVTPVRLLLAVLIILATAPLGFAAGDATALLGQARTHLAKGRYEEALETYQKAALAKGDSITVALGRSRAQQATGAWEAAEKTIEAALAGTPGHPAAQDPRLLARRAELQFLRGRYADTEKTIETVLKIDRENLLIHLVEADLHAETGRLAEANEEYRWFIRYYNDRQPEDAASLILLARGSVQYARWNHNTQIFHFVVNTLCPDALKNDPDAWEANLISGSLLLEKYNREQAIPDIEQALAKNPRAAEAIVLLGEDALDRNDFEKAEAQAKEALQIDPRLPSALRLKADLLFRSGRVHESLAVVASALQINPRDPLTLARIAAGDLIEDGLPERGQLEGWLAKPSRVDTAKVPPSARRFGALWHDIADWNSKPGVFLTELGRLLESQRRLDAAEVCYRRAIAVMPQLPEAKSSLGMLLMSIGKTDEAHAILDDAFKSDPFHMRVSNFRKVLKLLDGYQAITTEHFVIRVDSKLDKLLGGYMAEYLEQIYPQLVEQFGFAPPQRTQIEIYNKSGGTSGHEWFSARMVGMPWIQTIGASTGVMIAMASPTSAPMPFNWARVLRHEMVHVITVQESRFNIPQWFTEALAVLNEGYPPPEAWMELLANRVAKGDLRNLETLDRGFRRPANSDDWQFTYCQSWLYAQYMLARKGPDALKKMLDAYRNGASTPKAIQQVFGVDLAAFEGGYREFLKQKAAAVRPAQTTLGQPGTGPSSVSQSRPTKSVEQLERDYQAKPDDAAIAGAYAWALLEASNPNLARKVAKEALEKDATQPWASLVLARLDADSQQFSAAIRRLEPLLNRDKPLHEILLTLAKLKLLDDKPAEAVKLCELGLKHFSAQADFLQGLAAAYAQLDDSAHLAETLTHLCELSPDDPAPRKRLTELALKQKRYADAVRYGKLALHTDVNDAETHRQIGEAYLGIHEPKKALPELEAAGELKPKDNDIDLLLSKALIATGRKADAKSRLQSLVDRDANASEARALLDTLK